MEGTDDLFVQIADFVLPVLPPYELGLYIYLLRRSRAVGAPSVRVGKRTIGIELGRGRGTEKGSGSVGSLAHINKKLRELEQQGFITIGQSDRHGTVFSVALPDEVPVIRERMATELREILDPSTTAAWLEHSGDFDEWWNRLADVLPSGAGPAIGSALETNGEVTAMQNLLDALERIYRDLGDADFRRYSSDPRWADVISGAEDALRVIDSATA